jgi:hypothetical protein
MALEIARPEETPESEQAKAGETRTALAREAQDHARDSRQVAMVRQVEDQLGEGLQSAADSLVHEAQKQGVQSDIWGTIYGVFDKFPNGASVTKDKFAETFGEKSAQLLDKVGIQSISVTNRADGQHYKLGFAKEQTHTLKTAELTHNQTVEFNATKSGNALVLDDVKGLKVKKVGGHFSATVDQINVSHADNGDVVVVGKGHWGIFHGDKKITIAPDGTVTTDK